MKIVLRSMVADNQIELEHEPYLLVGSVSVLHFLVSLLDKRHNATVDVTNDGESMSAGPKGHAFACDFPVLLLQIVSNHAEDIIQWVDDNKVQNEEI